MKYLRRVSLYLAVLALLASLGAKASAQSTQDFVIQNFTADYYLDRNQAKTASLHVTEQISAVFPNYDQNHGILRALPQTYLDRTLSLSIDSVTDENNQPRRYTTYGQNDNLVLKIGDPDRYVHGTQVYKITYDMKNTALLLSDHDELYWNVNGTEWEQPFGTVTARLHVPPSLVSSLQERSACYVGAAGSRDTSRCSINNMGDSGSVIYTYQAQNLSSGETLTFVNGFKPGTFVLGPEIAAAQRAQRIKYALIGAGIVAPTLFSSLWLYWRWRKYGRDPKGRGVIIPEYQPYKGLNVLTSDYIFEEKLNTKAISALIIELAVKGYIAIYEKPVHKRFAKDTKTYSLKLVRSEEGLSNQEIAVLNMFFKGALAVGAEVDISSLKSSMADEIKKLKKDLGASLSTFGFFAGNPETAGRTYAVIGGAMLAGGFFLLTTGIFALIAASVGLAGLTFMIFGRYMPSRSAKGVEVRDHMLGLRDYIKLAEADRLKFLQSPQGTEKIAEAGLTPDDPHFKVKLFESLLPYAMVFNLEKGWAAQFQDVYSQPPGWYNGDWSTFNAVYLASSIGSFSSVNSVNFSPPRSSGGSGFGGGGFAGGGGGGGGGGGW